MFSLLLQEARQPHPPVPVHPHHRQATAGLLRGLLKNTESVLRAVFTKSSNRGYFWQCSPLHQPQSTAGSPCRGWVMLVATPNTPPCKDANTAMAAKPAQKTEKLSSAGLGKALCAGLWVPRLLGEISVVCLMLCLGLVRVGPSKKLFQSFSC